MKPVTVNIPEGLLEGLNKLVKEGKYPSRVAAVRRAVELLVEEHRSFGHIG